jgi:hypothetical protein
LPTGHAVIFSPLHHAPAGHALTTTAAFWLEKFRMLILWAARAAPNLRRSMSGGTPSISATISSALTPGGDTALMEAITSNRLCVF